MSTEAVLTLTDYLVGLVFISISTSIGFYFMHKDRKLRRIEKHKSYIYGDLVQSPTATGGITYETKQRLPPDVGELIQGSSETSSTTTFSSNGSHKNKIARAVGEGHGSPRSKQEISQYHLASRQLHFLPVSCSLTASFISALTMIGWPTEIYKFGSMFVYFSISYLLASILAAWLFIPFFYNKGYNTIYDFLLVRFNSPVLIMITKFVYLAQSALYSGIVIYAPSLALSSLNILPIWPAVFLTTAVCTFYTCLGGLKAVIWTDVVQSGVMVAGFIAICVQGIRLFGVETLLTDAVDDNIWQLDNFHFDIRVRHSFWAIVIGGTFGLWLPTFGVNQTEVQRYMACKSLLHARLAIFTTTIILWILLALATFSGFVMNTFFKTHPPPADMHKDEFVPYLILQLFSDYPGMVGMYIAAIYSGTLSTVSSSINSMSTVVVTTSKIQRIQKDPLFWSKVFVVIFGGICFTTAVAASKLGGVLEAAMNINSIVFAPTLGLFTLAIFTTVGNRFGAVCGYVGGIATGAVLYLTNAVCKSSEAGVVQNHFSNIDSNLFNSSVLQNKVQIFGNDSSACVFYMSYLYQSVCGLIVSLVLGFAVSFFTRSISGNS